MMRKYIPALLINFGILAAVFMVFIFIDVNINRAIKDTILSKKTAIGVAAEITLSAKPVFRCEKYIDWDQGFYNDRDELNDETNARYVMISSNASAAIAFYSYKKSYYRFDVARFILKGSVDPSKFFVIVYKNKTPVSCFSGLQKLHFSVMQGGTAGPLYQASWMSGWRPETGSYIAVLYYKGYPVTASPFEIISRTPPVFKKTISLLNLEYNQPINKRTIYNSRLQKTDFLSGLADWMNYGNIDAFFTLAGETTGWGNINKDKPWEYYPLKNLETIGRELSASNKLVGAYIMCFFTPKAGWVKAGYNPALGTGLTGGKFISFSDRKRFDDIVTLARYLNGLDYVDFIGFDFIRFGELTGYENADEFTHDMNIETPSGWDEYSLDNKILWLGSKLQGPGNEAVKEQWKLWIAHKTADFIYRVRKASGITKPMWVFTLGWDHGREHGQDPFFFQDAGVFADFVMLYEASPDMFESMKKSWAGYLSDEKLNYIPGNQIDSVLLKSCHGNNPVEEYSYRLEWASHYSPSYSKGVFIHDISRAFWGRIGDYSGMEWLVSGFSSASYNRWLNKEIPFHVEIITNEQSPEIDGEIEVPVEIHVNPGSVQALAGKTLTIENIGDNNYQKIDISGKTNIILDIKMNSKIGKVQWLGLCARIDGYPPYFIYDYIKKNNRNLVQKSESAGQGIFKTFSKF
jgi:hypothetical protein